LLVTAGQRSLLYYTNAIHVLMPCNANYMYVLILSRRMWVWWLQ